MNKWILLLWIALNSGFAFSAAIVNNLQEKREEQQVQNLLNDAQNRINQQRTKSMISHQQTPGLRRLQESQQRLQTNRLNAIQAISNRPKRINNVPASKPSVQRPRARIRS